jgi:lactobin A/cerein 7B family class IIb bacteriocin
MLEQMGELRNEELLSEEEFAQVNGGILPYVAAFGVGFCVGYTVTSLIKRATDKA